MMKLLLLLNIFSIIVLGTVGAEERNLLRSRRAVGRKPPNVVGNCGGNLEGKRGFIASPNFPRNSYPPLSSCNWTVEVDSELVVKAYARLYNTKNRSFLLPCQTFFLKLDIFMWFWPKPDGIPFKVSFVFMDLEDGPIQKGGNCGADYLAIRDAGSDKLIGNQKFCGYDTSFKPVFSETNRIVVNFLTDESQERSGFAIRWEAVEPPKPSVNCSFEMSNTLCTGWSQSVEDDFDWSIRSGQTPSRGTGPFYDYTIRLTGGDNSGCYAYIEATGKRQGEEAVLVTPPYDVNTAKTHCLRFWYNMRSTTGGMGSLLVIRVSAGQPRISGRIVFQSHGNQGTLWKEAKVEIIGGGESVQFMFVGIRGKSFKSDIAIDDITIEPNRCK